MKSDCFETGKCDGLQVPAHQGPFDTADETLDRLWERRSYEMLRDAAYERQREFLKSMLDRQAEKE